ncbi:hypothetical protein LZ30DRAFT_700671 [Colletotrichum cereale]|nr:hypothetical protein LZ30DRAFT_700671 [Colletotrichum cereale]
MYHIDILIHIHSGDRICGKGSETPKQTSVSCPPADTCLFEMKKKTPDCYVVGIYLSRLACAHVPTHMRRLRDH